MMKSLRIRQDALKLPQIDLGEVLIMNDERVFVVSRSGVFTEII